MGTGPEAAREAETAGGLLRRMIEGGFDAQDALQTLNALYILRGDGGFSTVDLAQLSLVTGEGLPAKMGRGPILSAQPPRRRKNVEQPRRRPDSVWERHTGPSA